jgi:hypothetical protein
MVRVVSIPQKADRLLSGLEVSGHHLVFPGTVFIYEVVPYEIPVVEVKGLLEPLKNLHALLLPSLFLDLLDHEPLLWLGPELVPGETGFSLHPFIIRKGFYK